MPSGVYDRKNKLTDEERKARDRAKHKKYSQTEKGKVSQKKRTDKYEKTEKGKLNRKKLNEKWLQTEKGKAYRQSPELKESMLEHHKKYRKTEKGKSAVRRGTNKFYNSEKGYLAMREEVLQYYSKLHSNSDIPCCRCCGESIHDFLALDHILGRKEMDSIPELVAIGYSSKTHSTALVKWIIENNFPDYFQILCQNCNFAKGIKRNNNKCPHEK